MVKFIKVFLWIGVKMKFMKELFRIGWMLELFLLKDKILIKLFVDRVFKS